jgi:signal transduction histidine kinase
MFCGTGPTMLGFRAEGREKMVTGSLSRRARVGVQVYGTTESRLHDALHEMRQPFTAMFALAEAARTAEDPSLVRWYLDQMIDQIGDAVGAMCTVLDPDAMDDVVEVDVDELISSVMSSFRVTWPGVLVRTGDRGGLSTLGVRAAVRRCLVNVLHNATRAAGPDGTVTVTVVRGVDSIEVVVEDDGPGFGRIPAGNGVGLRLSRELLLSMGGELLLGAASSDHGGARVVIVLPATTTAFGADGPAGVS